MKSTCWDTRATDSLIKSGQKDTEASIPSIFLIALSACVTHKHIGMMIYKLSQVIQLALQLMPPNFTNVYEK